jgi:hypothetical protein
MVCSGSQSRGWPRADIEALDRVGEPGQNGQDDPGRSTRIGQAGLWHDQQQHCGGAADEAKDAARLGPVDPEQKRTEKGCDRHDRDDDGHDADRQLAHGGIAERTRQRRPGQPADRVEDEVSAAKRQAPAGAEQNGGRQQRPERSCRQSDAEWMVPGAHDDLREELRAAPCGADQDQRQPEQARPGDRRQGGCAGQGASGDGRGPEPTLEANAS